MKIRTTLSLAALGMIALPTAAVACPLDGMAGFDGNHRMNPFANSAYAQRLYDEATKPSDAERDRQKAKDRRERARSDRENDAEREKRRSPESFKTPA